MKEIDLDIYTVNQVPCDSDKIFNFCNLLSLIRDSGDKFYKPTPEYFDEISYEIYNICDNSIAVLFLNIFCNFFSIGTISTEDIKEICDNRHNGSNCIFDFCEDYPEGLPLIVRSYDSWKKSHNYILKLCDSKSSLINQCKFTLENVIFSDDILARFNTMPNNHFNQYKVEIIEHLKALNNFGKHIQSCPQPDLASKCTFFQTVSNLACSTESSRSNIVNHTFLFNGKRILCEAHTKLSYRTRRDNYRIYFKYDEANDKIFIGSIGKHL